jgi:protein-tyrosine phosphatase
MRRPKIMRVIDLHVHILPGIDDGPADAEEALELARASVADGVVTVAATPHVRSDHPAVRPAELAQRCARFSAFLEEEAVRLRIVPAGEVDLLWAHGASDEELRLVSYAQRGTYLLLETPYGPLPRSFEDALYNRLVRAGFRVVLAHPERNADFQRDPRRLAELVRRGILLQLTAPALVRAGRRSRSRQLALALIEQGLAHLIASDAHGSSSGRGPELSRAVAEAARVAPARAEWMVTDAPAAILASEPLPAAPAASAGGRRLGRRLPRLRPSGGSR